MIRSIYFLVILLGCASPEQEGIEKIDATKLLELQKSGVQVVDIRTLNEYNQGHISGVVHIDFHSKEFVDKMKELGSSKPVVIHCAVGGRSGRASKILKDAGFRMIYDYSGGFSDWKTKGFEIEE